MTLRWAKYEPARPRRARKSGVTVAVVAAGGTVLGA